MLRLRFLAPLAAFIPLAAGLAFSLNSDPRRMPSTLIDKPTPAFVLDSLDGNGDGFSNLDLKGGVSLLNVFASWCPGCRFEHPMLMQLADKADIPIYGLNWKDKHDGWRPLAEH